ncbi:MAG: acyl-CoA dehydrogenase family protein [Actinomycetota bacterium]|nr:acyl-CoA dehydrogenase family protein [Actinomycetota bacterium]
MHTDIDAAELELVRTSMRHLLASSTAAALPAALIEGGWGDLLAFDTAAAVGVLADEQGRAVVAAPVLDLVLLHGLGLPLDGTTAVVLPPSARGDGGALAGGFAGVVDGTDVVIDGLLLAGHERSSHVLVATAEGVFAVDVAALLTRPTGAADPTLGLAAVSGLAPAGAPVASAAAWRAAIALGRRALAGELVGLAAQMLADTVPYVLQREQYGRAIGSFQTVKHRLADVHVAITAAGEGLATAWVDGSELSAVAALCLAARAQQLAATHCHQVHGGIAFTTEHGFHRFIRRGQSITALLGHPDDLVRAIGTQLAATRAVPRTPQLTVTN